MGRTIDSPAPYKEITAHLRRRLAQGEFRTRLPKESTLTTQYGVSRNTMRRALGILEREGLVKVTAGRGWFATARVEGGEDPGEPHYRAIARKVHSLIHTDNLVPGDPLPSESELARQHGVGRNTVQNAYALLEGSGLVIARPGRGRFVSDGTGNLHPCDRCNGRVTSRGPS